MLVIYVLPPGLRAEQKRSVHETHVAQADRGSEVSEMIALQDVLNSREEAS